HRAHHRARRQGAAHPLQLPLPIQRSVEERGTEEEARLHDGVSRYGRGRHRGHALSTIPGMSKKLMLLCALLIALPLYADTTLPDLFRKAKEEFSAGDYKQSLADFDLLDNASRKAGY